MKASALPLILILTAAFLLIISSMADFVTLETRVGKRSVASQKAFGIAEAGLEYYKWRLAHFPADFQDGMGAPGPYVHPYYDPQGGQTGQFSLAITPHNSCGQSQWVDISSTGQTVDFPTVKRILSSRYARPSIARYATIVNTNVWAGTDRTIKGLYHSNGGIRMDGTNDSLVTSALPTWSCTSSFGCSPAQTKPGIFGSGAGGAQGLWKFPVPPIDFTLISADLIGIKASAQASGAYIPRPIDIGYPSAKGYHVILNNDGSITVNVVKTTQFVWAKSVIDPTVLYKSYEVISQETFYNTYTLPAACSVMFLEGDIWIEGQVKDKMTIVSANLIDANVDTSVILNNNITYTSPGAGLTVIAEKNVRIPLYSPDVMGLNGIFMAQKGYFGRDYYDQGHTPWHIRTKLDLQGTIVSNQRVGTQWTSGGSIVSGYITRNESYDPLLATAPPPLTPFTSSEYKFVKWEEL